MTKQEIPGTSIPIEDLGKPLHVPADGYAVCTHCLICGDSVPLGMHENGPRVCSRCKEAVLAMRRAIRGGEEQ